MTDFLIYLGIFVVGGISGIGIIGLLNINRVDTKEYSYRLRKNIIRKLEFYKDRWTHLAEKDNLYMLGKIEAMDMAIKIVNGEFNKVESEVEGE